ncbi:MAG TPA: flagellar brake protein [Lachnospiraceae bacterium]|nr:flagellar brake protein [Lachnospiraceae bacterium]
MLSSYVLPGEKIEMQIVNRDQETDTEYNKKTYYSKVYQVLSDDKIEIAMPMEKTKLILLPVDSEYDVYFYSKSGLFQCFTRIIDRYKSNNVYIVVLELISNLRKYQRREFYRFGCALEMDTRKLQEEEIEAVEKNKGFLVSGIPLKRSIIVDISGGGLRFVANQKYEKESIIYCVYRLLVDEKIKEYHIIGKVLKVQEVENRPGDFEHRLQYMNLDTIEREEIIKFIFEEERKTRKREKNKNR